MGRPSEHRIFLGGYPGAGKTSLARWMREERGFFYVDLDYSARGWENPPVPRGHTVAEGGFLDNWNSVRTYLDDNRFFKVWCTGDEELLRSSRILRGDPMAHVQEPWKLLVDKYRDNLTWDLNVNMWDDQGNRKSFEHIYEHVLERTS